MTFIQVDHKIFVSVHPGWKGFVKQNDFSMVKLSEARIILFMRKKGKWEGGDWKMTAMN